MTFFFKLPAMQENLPVQNRSKSASPVRLTKPSAVLGLEKFAAPKRSVVSISSEQLSRAKSSFADSQVRQKLLEKRIKFLVFAFFDTDAKHCFA